MINAGSIVIASLLRNNLNLADRFDYVSISTISTISTLTWLIALTM